MKTHLLFTAILMALALVPVVVTIFRAYASPPGGITASNTAGLTDGGIVTRWPTTAFTVPNLVAGKGATAGKDILPCAATGVVPLGFVPDTAAIGEPAAVQMGAGNIVLGVASGPIGAVVPVYTDAGGKLTATGGTGKYLMGRSVTAAAANNDEFSLIPAALPVLQ
jgi:hypothetical protein